MGRLELPRALRRRLSTAAVSQFQHTRKMGAGEDSNLPTWAYEPTEPPGSTRSSGRRCRSSSTGVWNPPGSRPQSAMVVL
jgi:hypothetical protein